MAIEFTFLGTGTSSGVPMVGCGCDVCKSTNPKDCRLRTSALIQTNGKNIVIDAGMDFRQQMLRENVTHLDAIVLTHPHIDHMGGIDDVRAYNYFQSSSTKIYCNQITASMVRHMFSYAFQEKPYPGVPKIDLITIDENEFDVEGVKFKPIIGIHYNLTVYGYRIGNIAYITDMNEISSQELDKAKGCKVLVISALRKKLHRSHFTLAKALEIADYVGADTTYLTHISHMLGLHDEIEKELPKNVHMAYDGLKFLVD